MPDDIFAPGFFGQPVAGEGTQGFRGADTAPKEQPKTDWGDLIKFVVAHSPCPNVSETPLDLRAWRIAHGLSQFQLAVLLGVSLSTAIRWEHSGVPELRRAKVRAKMEEVR